MGQRGMTSQGRGGDCKGEGERSPDSERRSLIERKPEFSATLRFGWVLSERVSAYVSALLYRGWESWASPTTYDHPFWNCDLNVFHYSGDRERWKSQRDGVESIKKREKEKDYNNKIKLERCKEQKRLRGMDREKWKETNGKRQTESEKWKDRKRRECA